MPRKLMPSFRKEATTTSLAALTIQGIFLRGTSLRSECQVAEPFRIGLLKRQIRALGEIEPVERRADTVGVGECVLDGQAHIWHQVVP